MVMLGYFLRHFLPIADMSQAKCSSNHFKFSNKSSNSTNPRYQEWWFGFRDFGDEPLRSSSGRFFTINGKERHQDALIPMEARWVLGFENLGWVVGRIAMEKGWDWCCFIGSTMERKTLYETEAGFGEHKKLKRTHGENVDLLWDSSQKICPKKGSLHPWKWTAGTFKKSPNWKGKSSFDPAPFWGVQNMNFPGCNLPYLHLPDMSNVCLLVGFFLVKRHKFYRLGRSRYGFEWSKKKTIPLDPRKPPPPPSQAKACDLAWRMIIPGGFSTVVKWIMPIFRSYGIYLEVQDTS